MSKQYNPEMPSAGYDQADFAALMASNITPTLATNKQMHFDGVEDASVFFARELDYIKSKSYDKIYPEFTALNNFPITHEVPGGSGEHDLLQLREDRYGGYHQQLCHRPSKS